MVSAQGESLMSDQVTVFGANGRVGSLVVRELLTRGYIVMAFVHRSHQLPASERLKIIQGDIYNAEDVDRAIAGSTVVISVLGSWSAPKKDILTVGMTHIIASMQRHGISRIVSLTGAEARASGDDLSIVHRLMHTALRIVAGKVLTDGERHIQLLAQSGLDWTVVRSPVMSARQPSGIVNDLTMRRPLPWQLIPRRLVVQCTVDLINDTAWLRKAPYLT
jgi:putative NADH-flavin reductase